jgi:hypothetical protein
MVPLLKRERPPLLSACYRYTTEGGIAIARYRSYLVRVWISEAYDGPQWAGRVECIHSDPQPRRFNDMEAMLGYLRTELQRQEGTKVGMDRPALSSERIEPT